MADSCGHQVTLRPYFRRELEEISRDGEQKKLLPGVSVPERMVLTSDISCSADCELCIMAVPPLRYVRQRGGQPPICVQTPLWSTWQKDWRTAGYKRLSQVLEEELPQQKIVAMSALFPMRRR